MAAQQGIVDRLSALPKWLLIVLSILVVGGAGFGIYWFSFRPTEQPQEQDLSGLLADMPDAEVDDYEFSRTETFQNNRYMEGSNRTRNYWDELDDNPEDPLFEGATNTSGDGGALDPSVYSKMEIYQIQHGEKTRSQIDQEHYEQARKEEQRQRELENYYKNPYGTASAQPMTQQQRDSQYFARMEKAYEIAFKQAGTIMNLGQGEAAPAPAEETPEEEEERKLDLTGNSNQGFPANAFSDDGIISSLDSPSDNGIVHYAGTKQSKPVKATFLKNEKLTSGQRVIIRLMQDLTLSDGTIIPANTHITGTCSMGKRLKINVSMLHYGGRMFPTDISVYDNDGTEGIYCPYVDTDNKKAKVAKNVANTALQTAGTVVGTLLTGNALIGRMATSGLTSATSSIGADGTVTVNVTAGYEFYVFENLKSSSNPVENSIDKIKDKVLNH